MTWLEKFRLKMAHSDYSFKGYFNFDNTYLFTPFPVFNIPVIAFNFPRAGLYTHGS